MYTLYVYHYKYNKKVQREWMPAIFIVVKCKIRSYHQLRGAPHASRVA